MSKLLVIHPKAEELPTIADKVNALNKKSGPFGITILVGDALKEDGTVSEGAEFLQPTYFTEGLNSMTSLGENVSDVKENLTYLGKYGTFVTPEDVRIGYATGEENYLKEHLGEMTESLKKTQIDVLVTYQWPRAISIEQKLFLGNINVDYLVQATKPKYHFCVGSAAGKFFERAPFQWEDGSVTRFISLAKYGTEGKWIYAFNLNKAAGREVPKNATENPFLITINDNNNKDTQKRKLQGFDEGPLLEKPTKKPQRKVISPDQCFFCLGNPKLQAHMIISIGEHAYLTIAKGPLTRSTDKMKFSGHCLIIPVAHIPNLPTDTVTKSVTTTPVYNEILRFQCSLVNLFASFNLATVFFQINKMDAVHFHLQCFPIAEDFLIDFDKVLQKNTELNNKKFSQNTKLDFHQFENEDVTQDNSYLEIINSGKDYISFTLFDKAVNKQTVYISTLENEKNLDLQFGRRVMAYLLQTPKRIKWDKCQQSQNIEVAETEAFKQSFKPYDFTLDL